MRQRIRLRACLAVLYSLAVSHQVFGSVFWCHSQGSIEWLYQRPSGCDQQYTVQDQRSYVPPGESPQDPTTEIDGPQGGMIELDADYHSGVRAWLGVALEDRRYDARIQYSRLHVRQQAVTLPDPATGGLWITRAFGANVLVEPSFVNGVLFNPSGNPNLPFETAAQVSGQIRSDYDAADLQFGCRASVACDLNLRGFAALHWTDVYFGISARYQGTVHPGVEEPSFSSVTLDSFIRQTSDTWAIGPSFGIDGRYHVACGVGAAARIVGALLVGQAKYRFFQAGDLRDSATNAVINTLAVDTTNFRRTLVTPMWNARLGIFYEYCFRDCVDLSIEGGYEILTYPSLLLAGPQFRFNWSVTQVDCAPYSQDGFYLQLVITL